MLTNERPRCPRCNSVNVHYRSTFGSWRCNNKSCPDIESVVVPRSAWKPIFNRHYEFVITCPQCNLDSDSVHCSHCNIYIGESTRTFISVSDFFRHFSYGIGNNFNLDGLKAFASFVRIGKQGDSTDEQLLEEFFEVIGYSKSDFVYADMHSDADIEAFMNVAPKTPDSLPPLPPLVYAPPALPPPRRSNVPNWLKPLLLLIAIPSLIYGIIALGLSLYREDLSAGEIITGSAALLVSFIGIAWLIGIAKAEGDDMTWKWNIHGSVRWLVSIIVGLSSLLSFGIFLMILGTICGPY